ncbi:MAG: AI-2E family transporter [Leptospiraceae bacterium]|nr:AI-2E family transporter [Leptospiraceae bacterium]
MTEYFRRHPMSVKLVKYSFYILISISVLIAILGVKALALPILFSALIFYLFNTFVDYAEGIGIPRVVTILILFLILGGGIFYIMYELIPPLYTKISPLLSNWSNLPNENRFKFMNLNISVKINETGFNWGEIIKPEVILSKVMDYIKNSLNAFINFIPTLITYLIITPLVSFFLLLEGDKIYKEIIAIVPNRFFEMTLMITHKINEQITSYLKSLVIQGLIMATIVSIGLYLIGMEYFLLFGIFVGVANSIPYIGPILGAIFPVIFALVDNNNSTEISGVIGIIIFAQLVDNVIVQPAIIAKSVSLHPLVMIAGVVAGGELFGLVGMLLSIPVLSVLKVSTMILYNSLKSHQII